MGGEGEGTCMRARKRESVQESERVQVSTTTQKHAKPHMAHCDSNLILLTKVSLKTPSLDGRSCKEHRHKKGWRNGDFLTDFCKLSTIAVERIIKEGKMVASSWN